MKRKKRLYLKLIRGKTRAKSHIVKVEQIVNGEGKSVCTNFQTKFKTVKTNYKRAMIPVNIQLFTEKLKVDPIRTKRYEIFFTDQQKETIDKWMNAYIDMYNKVIEYFKNEFKKQLKKNPKFKLIDLNIDLNITKLKKLFSEHKSKLINDTNINAHILDYSINDACAMFKSKVSNLKNGHIKKSKLRYLKKTKPNKIIKIENYICYDHSFCPNILGNYIETYPKINFKDSVEIVSIISHNSKTGKYYLLLREYVYDNIIPLIVNNVKQLEEDNILDDIKLNNELIELIRTWDDYISLNNNNKLNDKINKSVKQICSELTENISCIKELINDTLKLKGKSIVLKDELEELINTLKLTKSINKVPLIDKTSKKTLAKYNLLIDTTREYTRSLSQLAKYKYLKLYKLKGNKSTNVISLDPGFRTFLTGISNIHTIEYGIKFNLLMKKKLTKIDIINNNPSIYDERKKKLVSNLYRKLSNMVDNFHWKVIKHLTNNYRHVVIGNLSTKSLGESIEDKMLKRIAKHSRLYVFRERLKYKCFLTGTKYYMANEYMTSKMCSGCSFINRNLGKAKKYNCPKCYLSIDRDLNAAKNILLQTIV